MIERRTYFVLGDLIASCGTAAVVGLLAAMAIGPGWHALLGAAVGMVIGVLVGLVLGLTLLQILFGAMEVMLPATLAGMLAGMWVGMTAARADVSLGQGTSTGALIGLGVMIFSYALNAHLTRRPHHG